ncbi:MAG: hypothetical protein ABIH09_04245, partial [Candidatus Omnitrophota bacterium]
MKVFKKITAIIVCTTFLCNQFVSAQNIGFGAQKFIVPSNISNKLRSAVSDYQSGLLDTSFSSESFVFPFIMYGVANLLEVESEKKLQLDHDAFVSYIKNLLGRQQFNDLTLNKKEYDISGHRRENGSILIPLSTEPYEIRFFFSQDKNKFKNDSVISEWPEISCRNSNKKICVRKIMSPKNIQEPFVKSANIASGDWPDEVHDELNTMIRKLINTKNDHTSDYNQSKMRNSFVTTLGNMNETVAPEIKKWLEKSIKAINENLTFEKLIQNLTELAQHPKFKCFFLMPEGGDDEFRFLHKTKERVMFLNANAHFGHNQTNVPNANPELVEQNIYIADPYCKSLGESDALGIIIHEMVHLLLGKGNDVHMLAEAIETEFSYAHADQNKKINVSKEIANYLVGKEKLFYAVSKNLREEALEHYKAVQECVNEMGKNDFSVKALTLMLLKEFMPVLEPVMGEIAQLEGFMQGDLNFEAMVLDQIFEEYKVSPVLGKNIYDNLKKMQHYRVQSKEMFLYYFMLGVSKSIAQEIKNVSNPSVPPYWDDIINDVIKEVTEALYDDENERGEWTKQIKSDISLYSFENVLPEKYFMESVFEDKHNSIMAKVLDMTPLFSGAEGAYNADDKRIYMRAKWDKKTIRSTIVHELVAHYMPDHGQIKSNMAWEHIAYSIAMCDWVLHAFDGDLDKAEENIGIFGAVYLPEVKALYDHGKWISETGKSLYILEGSKTDERAESFSIDLLVFEAIKVYDKMGLNSLQLKRYRENANKELSDVEKYQFLKDEYVAQEAVGRIMAGIMIGEYQKRTVLKQTIMDVFTDGETIWTKLCEEKKWIEPIDGEKAVLRASEKEYEAGLDDLSNEENEKLVSILRQAPRTGKHPVRTLKDFFQTLDDTMGPPSEADRIWVEKELILMLEALARQHFGVRVKFFPKDVKDRLGLWQCKVEFRENQATGMKSWRRAEIYYWPFTLYPDKRNPDRIKAREAAQKRAIGNLFLVIYRTKYAKDKDFEAQHKEWFSAPEFQVLWDALLLPRAISSGVPFIKDRLLAAKDQKMTKEIPDLIQRVFDLKYNLGDPEIEKLLYQSYPLHLQYLDSLLYKYTQYDPEKHGDCLPLDPRLKKGSLVADALDNTFDGWLKIMFQAGKYSNYKDIFEIIVNDKDGIWNEYKKLFEEDIEAAKQREMLTKMKNENNPDVDDMDPDNLTDADKDKLQQMFDALPKKIQEQIIKQIMDMMNSMAMGGGKPQPSKGHTPGGSKPGKPSRTKPSPFTPSDKFPSKDDPGQSIENMQDQLDQLDNMIESMENTLTNIADESKNVGKNAGDLKNRMPQDPKDLSQDGGAQIDEIDKKTDDLQDKANDLGRKGDLLENGAKDLADKSSETAANAPIPSMGNDMQKNASKFEVDTNKVNNRIKNLQDKVNKLRKLAKRMKELNKRTGDSTHVSQIADEIKNQIEEVKAASNDVRNELKNSDNSLEELKNSVKELVKEMADIDKSGCKGGKPQPGGEGQDKDGKPGASQQAGGEGQDKDGKPGASQQAGGEGQDKDGKPGASQQAGEEGQDKDGKPGASQQAGGEGQDKDGKPGASQQAGGEGQDKDGKPGVSQQAGGEGQDKDGKPGASQQAGGE